MSSRLKSRDYVNVLERACVRLQAHFLSVDGILDVFCFCEREWAVTTLHTYVIHALALP